MKTVKLLLSFALVSTLFTSCYQETVIVEDEPGISLNALLGSYELWYVDINSTVGYGTTPFLQKAFTMSFRNGVVYANNNIVGLGDTGNGYGIDVGEYDAYEMILDVYHDIDGFSTFDVYQIDNNTIELYNPKNDTSYFLDGYQRNNFDYDFVFYDNIHYFLQEYDAWEKTYTSAYGALNEFDNENFLQFLAGGNDSEFRSSQDNSGTPVSNLIWDYTGVYGVGDVAGDMYLKTLTLDYDYFDNEYFELSVINDGKIELYHPSSQSVYQFTGRGYIQYLKTDNTKGKTATSDTTDKMRKPRKDKVENPRTSTRV
ncbi:nicotinic acid mononucleotide adenyltransferase [Aestuariibaculum suncheonense]|uniref:Nicotinic acid mononucleotide adenyltransferase n=1 Tax=Aestuariibaculum suncheonense TaxID=1028745 RepID=A0A8J6ULV6_9FLAO|nr:nicotinic acid mononucleotide adenyltransferase [Aestuariibaculum suncheonense]MBD0836521.1 nicotinic acid mononucleotide adenyltransferase [Aestuariibaculum suncheonense]